MEIIHVIKHDWTQTMAYSSAVDDAVCVVDAKSGSSEDAVRLKVPTTFLPRLAQGTFELGEGDEPSNSYSFGQKAEFFQQTFSGKCLCQSGYVGIRLARSSRDVLQKDWTELREKIDREVVTFPDAESGLLFAGPVVHADSVSVYKVTESGDITGITLTADTEELD